MRFLLKNQKVLMVVFTLALVFGEYGASTDSRLSYIVSGWKIVIFLLAAWLLFLDSKQGFTGLKALKRDFLAKALVCVFLVFVLCFSVQIFLGVDFVWKGVARSWTFYATVLLALYCASRLFVDEEAFGLFRNTCRVLLVCFSVLAIFEILADVHLPESQLCDPEYLALPDVRAYYESNPNWRWFTATGIFYNTNGFCVLLAALSIFSLPSSKEKTKMRRAGIVLYFLGLLIVASLGATIVTVALFLACCIWLLSTSAPWKKWLAMIVAFIVVFQFLSTAIMSFLVWALQIPPNIVAADLTTDLGNQMEGLATQGGSLWARFTMYQDLLALIAAHPFGLGPGGLQAYFVANPTVTGLVDPHNWWLELAANYGVPAFLAYGAFFVIAFADLFKEAKGMRCEPCSIALAALAIPFFASLAPSSFDYNVLTWLPFLVGIGILVNRRADKAGR